LLSSSAVSVATQTPLITDRQFTEYCRDFAITCCKALGINDSPFHLEVFYDANSKELIFLELGARVGGADIPHVINDFFNINIYEIWIGRLLGGSTKIPDQPKIDKSVGFVLFPRPTDEPIITIESSQFINIVPEVYKELVPKKGDILSGKQTYSSILPGRYLLKGEIEASVNASILRIISDFNYKWKLLDEL
jgi:hypothetical protein